MCESVQHKLGHTSIPMYIWTICSVSITKNEANSVLMKISFAQFLLRNQVFAIKSGIKDMKKYKITLA